MDEIDAIGGRRFSEGTSADREIQRTLMELLNQLDGFDQLGRVREIKRECERGREGRSEGGRGARMGTENVMATSVRDRMVVILVSTLLHFPQPSSFPTLCLLHPLPCNLTMAS